MRFVVITGPSGAGKTLTLHSLEDAGYYAVDNLPPRLLPALVAFCRTENQARGAAVIDTRAGRSFAELPDIVAQLKASADSVELFYLDASDTVLLQRYKETRRPHPLRHVNSEGTPEGGIMEVIEAERILLEPVRGCADRILDTSSYSAVQLRTAIHDAYARNTRPGLLVTIVSFGFKHGLPVDADLVFDVRFLANPHYVSELRLLDGRDARVAAYVHQDPLTRPFQEKMTDLILFCLPEYVREGKAYLNIALGCTGGQHRSVTLAEELAQTLQEAGYAIALQHRDVLLHRHFPLDPSPLEETVSPRHHASPDSAAGVLSACDPVSQAPSADDRPSPETAPPREIRKTRETREGAGS